MPKYNPSYEDMYSTNPCFICGNDVLDENEDTCSDICRCQKEIFDADWEWFLMKDYEEEEEWGVYDGHTD